jgi:hypothetical protein
MAGHFSVDNKYDVRAGYTTASLLNSGIGESHHVSI